MHGQKIVCLLIILFLVAAAVAGCDFFKRKSPEEVPDSARILKKPWQI